ncbi:hypothetical protein F5Y16DRAFT_376889 [Xylariaceae sp. FL0255]|nr:hypothetical protein F5Y16DRAFT_376889 [Xylariaceae sp. FL0255]
MYNYIVEMKRRQGVQQRNRDDLYIYIQRRGKRLVLRSTKHCCPPTRDELDKTYPIPIQFTIEDKDDREKLQKKPPSSSGLLEIAPAAG